MKVVNRIRLVQTVVFIISIMFETILMGRDIETLTNQTQTPNPVTTNHIDSLNQKAFAEFRTNPAETRRMALRNLSFAKSINYKIGEGKAYNYIAMSYHIAGNYDTAYVYYEMALSIFESENDTLNTGKIYNNLALLFSHREYYNLALEYNFKSLEIAEKINNTESKFNSYNNIGITYEKLGEYDKAIDSYNYGLQVLSDENIINDLYYYAMGNMGVINLLTSHYDSARSQITRGLNYFLSVDNNYGISKSFSYLAQLAIKLNNYVEAEKFLSKSNFYAAKTDDKKLFITNQFFEAQILFNMNQLDRARKKFIGVLASAKERNYIEMEIESNLNLSKIDSIYGNFKDALKFYKSGIILKDSINSLKIQNQIAELNIQYQTLQKDKEIDFLKTNKEMQGLKIKKQLTQRKLLLAVLLGFLSTVIIGIFSYLKIQKKNNLLSLQNEEIADKNKELLYHQEKLEDIVTKRTAELIKAKEKAEESDRLKSAFLATMSHELRTPLNAIIGFSDVIQEGLTMDEVIRFNKNINISGMHLLNIVENLFDITLIQSGQINIKKAVVEIEPLMNEIYEVTMVEQEKAGKRHLKIGLNISEECKQMNIETDAFKLKQILINLLKNAIKFTNEGYVNYGVQISQVNNSKCLKFNVVDTGIGIPENKQDFIFDVFRQVEDNHTRKYDGIGIGLSIAKRLTELLGGEIWMNSKVGEGSSFYFTIPLLKSNHDNQDISVDIERNVKHEGKTILIVEDDVSSYEYLKVVTDSLKIKSDWAQNGKMAIEMCKTNPLYNLVLMDINLPIMNGYEATREIKKYKPELCIIAQTAYAISGDREKALEAGCDDYISKPIKRKELEQLLLKNII